MSPRPKRAPDSVVIQAAARVVAERGAAQTRLADVAAASGFAAATLVQRFGTREALLHAVGESYRASIRETFTAQASSQQLERLAAALERLAGEGHLQFLLAHPAAAPAYSQDLRAWIGQTLAAAVDSGELAPCDVASQARRVQLGFYGLLTAALLERDGSPPAIDSMVSGILADFM